MERAFVSYSHKDASFVDRLSYDLQANKIDVWLDVKDIPVGASVTKSIEGALMNCSAILLVLTNASTQSSWVQREFRAALQLQEGDENHPPRILPLVVEECEIPVFLRDTRWIDFRRGYDGAVIDIARALGVQHPSVPSSRFAQELESLLRKVEQDFHPFIGFEGSAPTHELFDIWETHERDMKRLAAVAATRLRGTQLDRAFWTLKDREDRDGKVALDQEPWPRASFVYRITSIVADVVHLGARYGMRSQLSVQFDELWKSTGVEFSN